MTSIWKKRGEKPRLEDYIRNLIELLLIPLVIAIMIIASIFFLYSQRNNEILKNVTTASEFNQNFKSDINGKLYYFVIESRYSEGIPGDEVRRAAELAENLVKSTKKKESLTAITSVLNLCRTLEKKMELIAVTSDYDDRQNQLENNIYVLTDMIQSYMYNYLYYESVSLTELQTELAYQAKVVFVSVTLLLLLLLLTLLSKSKKLCKDIIDPIEELSRRVGVISSGDLTERPAVQAAELEVQALSNGVEQMVAHLNELIAKNQFEESQRRNAELALLHSQLNPHFLYNTLDTIIWLIESGEHEKSVQMVNSLSTFFRFSMSRGKDVIPLFEEQQHIMSYLEIQQIRYHDILDYNISIPVELGAYCLPKLTLQPLVENALYHGIKLKRGKGHIDVTAREDGACIIITVADDGAGMTPERLEELRASLDGGCELGFGLHVIRKRLQLMFGDEYGISDIRSEHGAGTQIDIRIPKWLPGNKEADS